MNKVLFLMRYPIDDAYNLKLKFNGQMKACVNLGYDVYYIGYNAKHFYLCSYKKGEAIEIGKTHFHHYRGYRSTFAFFDLYSALSIAINIEHFDYIYMRSKFVTHRAVKTLIKYKKNGGKLIVEIPTYGVKEKSLNSIRKIAKCMSVNNRNRFEQLVDRYTLIGANCPENYKGKPAREISNGIDLDSLPIKKYSTLNSEIHMLALASMRDWQGFDRVVLGMGNYIGEYRLILHLVGKDFDHSIEKWMTMAKELGVESNVLYHGALYGEELTSVFDTCHLGIGAMAMHRRGDIVGSPLKVREYIARGIPYIYSYEDTSLSGNEWFALKFPENDEPVDFNVVVPWIADIYNNSSFITEMRRFAKEKLLWETQLGSVFDDLGEANNE